jgi:hypothetical protein
MIINCSCDDPWMDIKYGTGKRVANPCKMPSGNSAGARCTKCGSVKQLETLSPVRGGKK